MSVPRCGVENNIFVVPTSPMKTDPLRHNPLVVSELTHKFTRCLLVAAVPGLGEPPADIVPDELARAERLLKVSNRGAAAKPCLMTLLRDSTWSSSVLSIFLFCSDIFYYSQIPIFNGKDRLIMSPMISVTPNRSPKYLDWKIFEAIGTFDTSPTEL